MSKPEAGQAAQFDSTLRIDRWLWAARFFKTRSNAAEAVAGGHVHVDGERVKPARKIKPGDRLRIRRGPVQWEVTVRGTAARRGPATEARLLYEESEESMARRERERLERAAQESARYRGLGRPSRRERQEIDRLKGRTDPAVRRGS